MVRKVSDNLKKQSDLADFLDHTFHPQFLAVAKRLGVSVIQVHDSYQLDGSTPKVRELLRWMEKKSSDILQERRL